VRIATAPDAGAAGGVVRAVGGAVRLLGLATVAWMAVGCGSSHRGASVTLPPAPASTAVRPSTVPRPTSTTRRTSPTTVWKAAAPQPSPDAAASRLVGAWAGGDRAAAATVATPAAVAALFAVPYPGPGLALSRGCSQEFQPIVCTYGPPGGAPPADPVFEISVSQAPAGWYVSAIRTLS
jgi:hypothetical protein